MRLFNRNSQTHSSPSVTSVFSWVRRNRTGGADPYVLARNEAEAQRIDFHHYLLRSALKGNYAAPLQHPRSILDVGSGNGLWCIEVARFFPDARVVGMDVAIPKAIEGVPTAYQQNYEFVQGDVAQGLPFPDNTFDFVHERFTLPSVAAQEFDRVVAEMARVLAPGGWVESVQTAPPVTDSASIHQIARWTEVALSRTGRDVFLIRQMDKAFARAGFGNIVRREAQLPMGRYAGRAGRNMAINTAAIFANFRPLIVNTHVADAAEYDAALAQARDDMMSMRSTVPYYIVYAQKPA